MKSQGVKYGLAGLVLSASALAMQAYAGEVPLPNKEKIVVEGEIEYKPPYNKEQTKWKGMVLSETVEKRITTDTYIIFRVTTEGGLHNLWIPKKWVVDFKEMPVKGIYSADGKTFIPFQEKNDENEVTEDGKKKKILEYMNLEQLLNAKGIVDPKSVPELTIDDLRKISDYPELELVADCMLSPGKKTQYGETVQLDKGHVFVEGHNGYMIVKNDTSAIQNAISIKHFTKEGMNGVCHPKDLILLEPMAQKKRMIEAILRNYIPNRTFTSSTFAPDMRECIIGKFKIRDQDYLVIDSHLFFNEYFETFARDSAGTKHAINYNNFLGGYRPVDFWREFVNLRGKSEKEIEAFNKNISRTFVSKKVKFAGMDYTFVAHNPKDLEEADKISENLAKSKAGEIKIEQFADLISSGSSDAVDKIVQGKETLSDVVETLNGFFKGKMAKDSVDDWHVEAEKLVGYRKHDCDTSSKIVVNALRKKGFPANMLVVEGPMKDNKTQIGHAWAEVYIPSKDVILTIDFSDPSRNYIFKADSRQKMKYMFDKYGSKTRPFQMTFSQAFDL